MQLKIISSTDRPNSKSLEVSGYIQKLYDKQGVDTSVVSLEDFPLQDVAGGKYGEEIQSVKNFRDPVLNADALLFVIPEYNGGFPGILKVFIDYLPFPGAFEHLPMAFIGVAAGAFGALRAVEQFQMVANYRNSIQFPERVFINRVSSEFDPESGLKNEFQQKLLEGQTKNFIGFVRRLKDN
ncbi:MAG: NADPH-dependent oxidoreductase [Balneola sp.]|nr:MAG: NADPH-dependent oxidoreductase [Balneola sp.]